MPASGAHPPSCRVKACAPPAIRRPGHVSPEGRASRPSTQRARTGAPLPLRAGRAGLAAGFAGTFLEQVNEGAGRPLGAAGKVVQGLEPHQRRSLRFRETGLRAEVVNEPPLLLTRRAALLE